MYEFHINRNVRKKYGLDTTFFSTTGNVVFANFHAVRLFVYKINQMRKPGDHVYPGEVNAAGLLEEIYHLVLREYEKQLNPQVFDRAEQYLFKEIGKQQMDDLMLDFIEIFPPLAVYQGKQTAEAYLKSTTGERPNSLITIEEMMMTGFGDAGEEDDE